MKNNPCPQCDSTDVRVILGYYDEATPGAKKGKYAVCFKCGYPGPVKRTESAAINAWNQLPERKK